MTVKLTGDWGKCKAALAAVSSMSFTDVHKKIGEYLRDDVHERFDKGVGPDGKPWPQSRRAREQAGQTLVDSRRLESSIAYKASPDRLDLGTNVKYARIHQMGGVIKPKRGKALRFKSGSKWRTVKTVKMPARPFLGVSEKNAKQCIEILKREIERRLK